MEPTDDQKRDAALYLLRDLCEEDFYQVVLQASDSFDGPDELGEACQAEVARRIDVGRRAR